MSKMQGRPDSADYQRIFLQDVPLIDVRAPIEFQQGAFAQAVNLPLMVDSEHQLSQLSRHIVTDRISALFDGFIITDKGRYAGVGTGVGLMRMIQSESEERNRKLVALAEQLGQARLEALSANRIKTEFVATMSHEKCSSDSEGEGKGVGRLHLQAKNNRHSHSLPYAKKPVPLSGYHFARQCHCPAP